MTEPRRALCYVRPWNQGQLTAIAEASSLEASRIGYCSEHADYDEAGLVRGYEEAFRRGDTAGALEEEVQGDMVARCRVLRKLPPDVARRHLGAMSISVERVLAKLRPDSVISLTVDSFVIDLLRHHSIRLGIRFVGLVPTFVNGYFRVTGRGEPSTNPRPQISPQALRSLILDRQYLPSFATASMGSGRSTGWGRWARNLARAAVYWTRTSLSAHPWNYHHWQARLESAAAASLLPAFPDPSPDWRAVVSDDPRPSLYVPLQMFPEATVDYWCPSAVVIDYPETLSAVVGQFGEEFHLVFKEHPNVLGTRPSGFYDRLRHTTGCTMVPTFTHSNEVVEATNATLVWTGSVGFEAALRGKAVVHLGDPYYAHGSRFMSITPTTAPDSVRNHVEACQHQPTNEVEQLALAGHLSEQLFRGRFLNNGTWDRDSPEHRHDARTMGESLRPLLGSSGASG